MVGKPYLTLACVHLLLILLFLMFLNLLIKYLWFFFPDLTQQTVCDLTQHCQCWSVFPPLGMSSGGGGRRAGWSPRVPLALVLPCSPSSPGLPTSCLCHMLQMGIACASMALCVGSLRSIPSWFLKSSPFLILTTPSISATVFPWKLAMRWKHSGVEHSWVVGQAQGAWFLQRAFLHAQDYPVGCRFPPNLLDHACWPELSWAHLLQTHFGVICWNWGLSTTLLAGASVLELCFASGWWEKLLPWLFWHCVFPRLVSVYWVWIIEQIAGRNSCLLCFW